jgi:ribosomal protein S18 acetylase RimI-like enzyme
MSEPNSSAELACGQAKLGSSGVVNAFFGVARLRRRCEKRPMSSALSIRPARDDDESAIGRLGAMLVAEHHDFDRKRFIAPSPELPQRYGQFLVSQITRPDMLVLVAERGGEVVGYAYAGVEGNDYMALRGPAGVLYDLVVDLAHRRQGVGTALLDAVFDRLRKLGAPRVLLFTADKNHVAQAMFDRAGFRRTMIEMTRELGGGD